VPLAGEREGALGIAARLIEPVGDQVCLTDMDVLEGSEPLQAE
jgi:hypothetical protein